MKLIIAIITVIILSAILENFLPWWIIALVAFIISYLFKLKWYNAFLAGFVGLFLLWGGISFFIDHGNEHILSDKISLLFFKSIKPFVVVAMTGVIGGLVAGFAGLAGSLLRRKDTTGKAI
jgi:ABC-type multidrug transport system fused ATPase/permease subunit